MDSYLTTLYEIVTRGRNTNSYKFALWRALARLASDTDAKRPVITKQALSPLFLEYYWHLEITYHIRQGIDPDKDPIVMVLIRQLANSGIIRPGERLGDFKNRMPRQYSKLVDTVSRAAFDDVIPRFHIIHGAQISAKLFTFSGQIGKVGNEIELTNAGRQFLIQYRKLIDYVAIAGWVRFTERFTSAPRLYDKISGVKVKKTQSRDGGTCW
jgi:hypothetical protein